MQNDTSRLASLKLRMTGIPRWLKWTILIMIPILLVLAIALARGGNDVMMVNTVKVEVAAIEQSVMANGRLESSKKQEFFTPVDSTLMELSVKVGDKVAKGEVFGRLDTLELGRRYEDAKSRLALRQSELAAAMVYDDELALAAAQAQYDREKNNFERISYLHQEGAVTTQELETAQVSYAQVKVGYYEAKNRVEQRATDIRVASLQAQVDLAQQEVAQAKERLDLATFIAEEDGVVLYVGAEKGNRVLEGSRLLVVGSASELEVTATVNEIDAGNLQAGQQVRVTCTSLPHQLYTGEVTRVAAVAVTGNDNNTGVPVTVQLQGDTTGLKPGYTVDLTIITMEEEQVLAVPFEAIVSREGERFIYAVEDGVAKERQVKTKKGNELFDMVISGVDEGEEIIINPPHDLRDGQQVVIGVTP